MIESEIIRKPQLSGAFVIIFIGGADLQTALATPGLVDDAISEVDRLLQATEPGKSVPNQLTTAEAALIRRASEKSGGNRTNFLNLFAEEINR